MAKTPNFLFIMVDQLRSDYLGCAGHRSIQTPNIDALAKDGIRFTQTQIQGPVCGSSRMSFYTGRYVMSHGATYNGVPVNAGEKTLGDYLRPLGYRVALVGKTHFKFDYATYQRLGVDMDNPAAQIAAQGGFEPFERDDGLHPDKAVSPDLAYNRYLNKIGYEGHNPWHHYANSALDTDGKLVSGWYMRNAPLPARVAEEHSESAYMTNRAIDFMKDAQNAPDQPWCLHLSYIKPHWPYMAPEPYHAMYGQDDIQAPNMTKDELNNAHPVVAAFRQHKESVSFSKKETRDAVIPTYMGLISQIDDHLGRLFAHMKQAGLWDNTVIIFTSDHGDYLGDHWLGEKELFHEEIQKIPLIIRDPNMPTEAKGSEIDHLVESIDLIPTMIDRAGGEAQNHILEGRSLLPFLLNKTPANWREAAFSEEDYGFRGARKILGLAPDMAKAKMIRTDRYKLNLYRGFDAELFDLQEDPKEQINRAGDPVLKSVQDELMGHYIQWLEMRKSRPTISNEAVDSRTEISFEQGYVIGYW